MLYNPLLETFICVAKAGSFNKAAEELFTGAGCHQQVGSLEQDVNLPPVWPGPIAAGSAAEAEILV